MAEFTERFIAWYSLLDDQDYADEDHCDVTFALREMQPATPVMARELGYVPEFDEINWRFSLKEEKAKEEAVNRAKKARIRAEKKSKRDKERKRKLAENLAAQEAAYRKKNQIHRKEIQRSQQRAKLADLKSAIENYVDSPKGKKERELRSKIEDINAALGAAFANPRASQKMIDELKAMRQRASRQLRDLA